MSKRRTKIQKLRAQLHKHQAENINRIQDTRIKIQEIKPEISQNKGTFYTPSLQLPMEMLKKDLTKTLLVTILAVILQMSLAYYLNHGGWKLINSLVISKLMSSG